MRTARALRFGLAFVFLCACEPAGPPAGNHAPYAPLVTGPGSVAVGEKADFSVEVHDPDGGLLRVFIACGDGDTTDHGEFVNSGQVVWFEHIYLQAGTYTVRARCHDTGPLFSDWSSPRPVVVGP